MNSVKELEQLAIDLIRTPDSLRRVSRKALCQAAGCTLNNSFSLQRDGELPPAVDVKGSHPHYHRWEILLIETCTAAGYSRKEITKTIIDLRKQIPSIVAEQLREVV